MTLVHAIISTMDIFPYSLPNKSPILYEGTVTSAHEFSNHPKQNGFSLTLAFYTIYFL